MRTLFTNAAQIITCNTDNNNYKRGKDLSQINILENHSILCENGVIKDIIPDYSIKIPHDKKINLSGKVILPGLIDCHTHTAFAGSRANEFKEKIAGVHYEEIARRGGGINSTVTAVRNSSVTDLVELMKPRIKEFISQGVTTLEIKSGYGLDFDNEIKLLHAIKIINEIFPIDITSTFLGAHTFPTEFKDDHSGYVELIVEKMIPHVAKTILQSFVMDFVNQLPLLPGRLIEYLLLLLLPD